MDEVVVATIMTDRTMATRAKGRIMLLTRLLQHPQVMVLTHMLNVRTVIYHLMKECQLTSATRWRLPELCCALVPVPDVPATAARWPRSSSCTRPWIFVIFLVSDMTHSLMGDLA